MNTINFKFRKGFKIDAIKYIEMQSNQPHQSNSAYKRGVIALAIDLLDEIDCDALYLPTLDGLLFDGSYSWAVEKLLLNGASDWMQYSFGGCAFCYNHDIEKALLPQSRWGRYSGEWLLKYQAKALYCAFKKVLNALKHVGALDVKPIFHSVSDYYISPSNLCNTAIKYEKVKKLYNNTYIECNQYSRITANGKGRAILKRLNTHLHEG